jgi:hypothetical protein
MIDKDKYGEIYNTPNNYELFAQVLNGPSRSLVMGWTDQEGSHLDILLVLRPQQTGSLQRGLSGETDLFVAVMGFGCHGFDATESNTHPGYIGEKLRLGSNVTTGKLTELINGVRAAL